VHQAFHLILGQWKSLVTIGLGITAFYKAEEEETSVTQDYFNFFKSKYPKLRGFNTVLMIRHMTS
jgi:hypothetical protein